jgi:hypothetical protein
MKTLKLKRADDEPSGMLANTFTALLLIKVFYQLCINYLALYIATLGRK